MNCWLLASHSQVWESIYTRERRARRTSPRIPREQQLQGKSRPSLGDAAAVRHVINFPFSCLEQIRGQNLGMFLVKFVFLVRGFPNCPNSRSGSSRLRRRKLQHWTFSPKLVMQNTKITSWKYTFFPETPCPNCKREVMFRIALEPLYTLQSKHENLPFFGLQPAGWHDVLCKLEGSMLGLVWEIPSLYCILILIEGAHHWHLCVHIWTGFLLHLPCPWGCNSPTSIQQM